MQRVDPTLRTTSVIGCPYLIHHFLENSADIYPEKEAVVHENERFSYMDIELRSNRISNGLLALDLKKGDRVALLLRNSVEYICSYYGILKAGGVVVPLNTSVKAKELLEMISDCSPKFMIYESIFAELIENLVSRDFKGLKAVVICARNKKFTEKFNIKHISLTDICSKSSEIRPEINTIDQDLATIIYTSGSTGSPKGVMLSHLNVASNTASIVSYLKLCYEDRCMTILPFYYVYGKSLLNTHFAVSATVIIDNRFAFPSVILKKMIEEKATGFAGVPSTYSILLNRSSIAKARLPDLRYVTQAGGHLPAKYKRRLLEVFPDKEIYIMYGATEASARLSYLEPEAIVDKLDSIGKAIPNVELKVIRRDGLEAAAGEEGEIIARGSNIMLGYWNDTNETQKVLKHGWDYTGDLGFKDKDGFFFIRGRKRDLIKVDVHKVSAKEIEEVLYECPGVIEAAVIGVPDKVLGEAIIAFIAIKPSRGLMPKTVKAFCKEVLPNYKVPKEIRIIKNLPKSEVGKISKNELLEGYIKLNEKPN